MSWRPRLSVETILGLTPAVLGSTVFSIAWLWPRRHCLWRPRTDSDPQEQRSVLDWYLEVG